MNSNYKNNFIICDDFIENNISSTGYRVGKNESYIDSNVLNYIKENENLIYSIKDNVRLNEIFCEFYKKFSSERNDKKIYALFSLLFKIEQINSHKAKINSSHQIPVSTVINYVSEKKDVHPFVLIKNSDNFLIFEIPQSFYSDENKPKVLDKLHFIFKSSSGLTYYFSTRVINYEKTEIFPLFCNSSAMKLFTHHT